MSPIHSAWHLTPAGERLAAQVDGDTIRLAHPMHEWEVLVVSQVRCRFIGFGFWNRGFSRFVGFMKMTG